MAKDIIKLGDVATYINGYAFKPEDRGEEGLQIIRIQDLTGNSYDLGFYNGKYPKKIEINDGDVLISWSASLGVYVWNGGKALLNQHIFKVKFDKVDIDKSYFVYAVRYKLNDMGKKTHGDRIKDDPMAGPEAYWINTSGNELVKRFIDKAGKTTRNEIERLIAGEAIDKQIRLDMTYDEIDNNIDNLWSVLFTTGYLTYTKISENKKYSLVIPNNEIKEVFKLQIQEWFRNKIFSNTDQLQDFWKAFKDGNTQIMEMYLNKVLSNSVSVFDTKARNDEKESSYHNLLIGILSGNEDWLVKSNVEAGEGFADIIVETDDPDEGIIAELKYTKDFKAMEKSCEKALKQIKDRRYQEYLLNDDRQNIMYYGITFCRKRCKVLVER